MDIIGLGAGKHGLENHGLFNTGDVYWNLSEPALYEEAIQRGEGVLTRGGALSVNTGVHTGRAPKDKFIVDSPLTHGEVDWGAVNKAISPEQFDVMHGRMAAYYQDRDAFVL